MRTLGIMPSRVGVASLRNPYQRIALDVPKAGRMRDWRITSVEVPAASAATASGSVDSGADAQSASMQTTHRSAQALSFEVVSASIPYLKPLNTTRLLIPR